MWQWLGHVFRMSDAALVKQVLTSLKRTGQPDHDFRRSRTGPDNSGHRPVLRYLQRCGLTPEHAADRRIDMVGLRTMGLLGPLLGMRFWLRSTHICGTARACKAVSTVTNCSFARSGMMPLMFCWNLTAGWVGGGICLLQPSAT